MQYGFKLKVLNALSHETIQTCEYLEQTTFCQITTNKLELSALNDRRINSCGYW